jgi:hypothetical protein
MSPLSVRTSGFWGVILRLGRGLSAPTGGTRPRPRADRDSWTRAIVSIDLTHLVVAALQQERDQED